MTGAPEIVNRFGHREERKRLERLQRSRNKRAQQDNTPADLRVVVVVVAAFTRALVLLTKLALGL